jgi:23S rRNA pseudouridine2605 synthase
MNMPSVPLLKALAEAGVGSRRWITDAIKNGRVEVNGEPVEDFRHPVNPETDRVSLHGKLVDLKPRRTVYLMVNKPAGILATTSDERGRKTVLDIMPEKYRHLRLYPVGRLDKDSTGLLLLTNDGELTYKVTHPRFEHKKEYLIHIDGVLKPEERRKLERGLELEDGMTYPVVVKEIKSQPPFNYSITMHEGRKRQVRRMLANLGYRVLALKRIRMGNLNLGNLKEGTIRELTPEGVRALLTATTSKSTGRDRGQAKGGLKNGKYEQKNE